MRYRGIDYLVGTPKGHLTHVEKQLLEQPWIRARESVRVKILQQESEFYVYVESHDRVAKNVPCVAEDSNACGQACTNFAIERTSLVTTC